jgi:hypothetical protein
MARKNASAAAPPVRLIPSASSFDFLEGAFAASQRARKVGIAIALGALTVLTVLALAGVSGLFVKQAQTDLLTQVQSDNSVAVSKLAQLDNAGGISADQISAHIAVRRAGLKTAVGKEIDVVKLTRAIRASAPAGMTVSSITFKEAVMPAKGASSSSKPAPAAAAGAANSIGTVEIKASATSFPLIEAWTQSVRRIPGLTTVDATWMGSPPVPTTITASLTADALTARAKTLSNTTGKGNG